MPPLPNLCNVPMTVFVLCSTGFGDGLASGYATSGAFGYATYAFAAGVTRLPTTCENPMEKFDVTS